MPRLVVANHKGGVGKTTLAFHLAHGLREEGVLLWDMDPQANLTQLLAPEVPEEALAAEAFAGRVPRPLEVAPGMWLVAGDPSLSRSVGGTLPKYRAVERALSRMELPRWVILDTPPSISALTVAGLLAGEWLLAPADPSGFSVAAVEDLLELLGEVAENVGRAPRLLGLVAVGFSGRTRTSRAILSVLRERAPVVGIVPPSTRVREALTLRVPVWELDPQNPAARALRELVGRVRELVLGP